MRATVKLVHQRGHLRTALGRGDFRRLLAIRLTGQLGDGVFQAALAASVLFNPDHQAHASDIAAGFAVILLPYSLIGPFAGVLLDRWWRQRVLMLSNVLRSIGVLGVAAEITAGIQGEAFYASALVVISLNRFFLSALSASLPHTVERDELVTANSVSVTAGAIAATIGGALAVGLRAVVGDTDQAYGVVAVFAAVPYLASALTARGFGRSELGPDDVARTNRETFSDVAHGLAAGARHIAERRPALYALTAIGVHRFCYGMTTICTLLLYRNYFHDDGFFRAGLGGMAQVVALIAIGGGVAAVVTPPITRRIGFIRWSASLIALSAVTEVVFGLPYRLPMIVIGAGLLGFAAQGIKICVDTLVQQSVEDEFRGRVFSLYDTLFNITFVSAAVATALLLPETGYAPASVVALAIVYAVTAVVYLRVGTRAQRPTRATSVPAPSPVSGVPGA